VRINIFFHPKLNGLQNLIKKSIALSAIGIFLCFTLGFAKEGISPALRQRAAADRIPEPLTADVPAPSEEVLFALTQENWAAKIKTGRQVNPDAIHSSLSINRAPQNLITALLSFSGNVCVVPDNLLYGRPYWFAYHENEGRAATPVIYFGQNTFRRTANNGINEILSRAQYLLVRGKAAEINRLELPRKVRKFAKAKAIAQRRADRKIPNLYAQAEYLYGKNRLKEAAALSSKIIAGDPDTPTALAYLCQKAQQLYDRNKLDEAEIIFGQIAAHDHGHQIAKNYLSKKIPARRGELAAAEKNLKKGLSGAGQALSGAKPETIDCSVLRERLYDGIRYAFLGHMQPNMVCASLSPDKETATVWIDVSDSVNMGLNFVVLEGFLHGRRYRPIIPDPRAIPGNRSKRYKATVFFEELDDRLEKVHPGFTKFKKTRVDIGMAAILGWGKNEQDRQKRWSDGTVETLRNMLGKSAGRLAALRRAHPREVGQIETIARRNYQRYLEYEETEFAAYDGLMGKHIPHDTRLQDIFEFSGINPTAVLAEAYYDVCRCALLEELNKIAGAGVDVQQIYRAAEIAVELEWEAEFSVMVRERAVDFQLTEALSSYNVICGLGVLFLDPDNRPVKFIPGGAGAAILQDLAVYYYPFSLSEWFRPGYKIVIMIPSITGYPNFEQLSAYMDDWLRLQRALTARFSLAEAPEVWLGVEDNFGELYFYRPKGARDPEFRGQVMGRVIDIKTPYSRFQESLQKNIYAAPSLKGQRDVASLLREVARASGRRLQNKQLIMQRKDPTHVLAQELQEAICNSLDAAFSARTARVLKESVLPRYMRDFEILKEKARHAADSKQLHWGICYLTRLIQLDIAEALVTHIFPAGPKDERESPFEIVAVAGLSEGKTPFEVSRTQRAGQQASQRSTTEAEASEVKMGFVVSDLMREVKKRPDIFPVETLPAVEKAVKDWVRLHPALRGKKAYTGFEASWNEAKYASESAARRAGVEARATLEKIRDFMELVTVNDEGLVHSCVSESAGLVAQLDPVSDAGLIRELQRASVQLNQKFDELRRLANLSNEQKTAQYLLENRKFELIRREPDPNTQQAIELLTAILQDRPYRGKEKSGRLAKKLAHVSQGRAGDPHEFYEKTAGLAGNYRSPDAVKAAEAALTSVLRPRATAEKNSDGLLEYDTTDKIREIYTDKDTNTLIIVLQSDTVIAITDNGTVAHFITNARNPNQKQKEVLTALSRHENLEVTRRAIIALESYERYAVKIDSMRISQDDVETALRSIDGLLPEIQKLILASKDISEDKFSAAMRSYIERLPPERVEEVGQSRLLKELRIGYDDTISEVLNLLSQTKETLYDLNHHNYKHQNYRMQLNELARISSLLHTDFYTILEIPQLLEKIGILSGQISILLSYNNGPLTRPLRDDLSEIESSVLRPRAALEISSLRK